MRTSEASRGLRRLQLVLLLMIVWEVLAIVAELTFGGPLFKISDGEIGGIIGGRGGFSGLALVPLAIYAYVLLRGPLRFAGLLWVGVLEQGAAALFIVYHLAVGVVKFEASIAPLIVSGGLVILLLVNMPRNEASS